MDQEMCRGLAEQLWAPHVFLCPFGRERLLPCLPRGLCAAPAQTGAVVCLTLRLLLPCSCYCPVAVTTRVSRGALRSGLPWEGRPCGARGTVLPSERTEIPGDRWTNPAPDFLWGFCHL